MKQLYLVFSSTPYILGKFVRFFTRETYNHVSLSTDSRFEHAYSFARRYRSTPLYGGLVQESSSRYKNGNKLAQIAVCRLDVSDETHEEIINTINTMFAEKEKYIYNTISAIATLNKKCVRRKNAYTCVEFATLMLSSFDNSIDKEGFYSVEDLLAHYEDKKIYEGAFNFPLIEDIDFEKKYGLLFNIKATAHILWQLRKRK